MALGISTVVLGSFNDPLGTLLERCNWSLVEQWKTMCQTPNFHYTDDPTYQGYRCTSTA